MIMYVEKMKRKHLECLKDYIKCMLFSVNINKDRYKAGA